MRKVILVSEGKINGILSKLEYSSEVSQDKFDRIYSILKNEDN